jgi:hypothetical protein
LKSVRNSRFVTALAIGALVPGEAAAHALMRRYDLPVPLAHFVGGSVAAVALSFIVAAVVLRSAAAQRVPTLSFRPGRTARAFGNGLGAVSLALLALLIAAGLIGAQHPVRNITPVAVWVVWWVGFAFVAALVVDPWPALNPWAAAARAVERLSGAAGGYRLPMPRRLESWPAVALFALFSWMELVWPLREKPAALSAAILAYTLLTFAAMVLFGREAWLACGEVFAKLYGIFGRFAPVRAGPSGGLALGPPAAGLVSSGPADASTATFVLLMLSAVTFDGLLETPLWRAAAEAGIRSETLQHMAAALGGHPDVVIATLGLAGFAVGFATLYLATCLTMSAMVGGRRGPHGASAPELARTFVWSLVPISIAYHLAHYLSYLLVAGQLIFPLASDPFGWGWDLFGTRGWRVRLDVVGPRFLWWTSVIAIVTGHVFAVWIAHLHALRRFAAPAVALRSQVPMVVLMIAYTAGSLWILAQPITEPPN